MSICNNCKTEITGKFCSSCGRPKMLKRIDAHYIQHEIEHVLHLEKGILYTVKELILRPGKRVREFIHEDRNRLVKPIIFIIITSLIYSLINNYFHIEDQYVNFNEGKFGMMEKMLTWIQQHYGYANIIMAIFIAFFLRLFFKSYQYNLFELVILLCYLMGVGMLIFAVFALIEGLTHSKFVSWGGVLGMIYFIWAIGDFYGRNALNYLKATGAYILGIIAMYGIIIILGLIFYALFEK